MMKRFLLVLIVFAGALSEESYGQRKVTVETMYSGAIFATDVEPDTLWRPDGKLLAYDKRRPDMGFRLIDPKSGAAAPLLDESRAAAALAKAGMDAEAELSWPEQFSEDGNRWLFVGKNDLFVFDTTTLECVRATETPDEEEKAPRLSPDGKKVAYVKKNDLYVFDIASKKTTRLTSEGTDTVLCGTVSWVYWEEIFGRQDIGYWWSDDSTTIAFLKTDESPVPEVAFVDFKPTVPEVKKQRYPKAGNANPVVAVGIVALADEPKVVWADLSKKSYEYIARVQWLNDSKRLAVQTMNRAQNELDLRLVDKDTGAATIVLTEKDEAWVNIHDDLVFLEDGAHFLWVSERTGFAHIYRYKLDGTLVNAVTAGEWAVRDTGAVYWLHQAIKHVDEKNGWVYFTTIKDNSIENQVYRAKLDGSASERLTKENGVHSPSFSKDGAFFVDSWSNARTPKTTVVRNADGTQSAELAAAFKTPIERIDPVYPEFFTVKARDGFVMPAFIYKPKDFDPTKKYPVILYCYGGPAAPSVTDAWNGQDLMYAQILLQEGFLYACIDNRSATNISKKTENAISGQMYGDSELDDLLDGVAWLKSEPYVDSARVGIWGWSGGGSYTLLALTRSKEFKAGIAVAGVTRWEYYDTKWGEASMKRPQDNEKGYKYTDLTRRAKNLSGRLLLVHGTYDDNVHIQNTWHFVDELVKAGKLFEMMIYPMRKHGLEDLPARLHLYRTMVEFWKRSL